MKLIPTTATAVEKLKTTAKGIKHASDLTHQEALERAASEAGYESWFHVLWCAKQGEKNNHHFELQVNPASDEEMGNHIAMMESVIAEHDAVSVINHPAKGDVFHHVEIDGIHFLGCVDSGGPYIAKKRPSNIGGYEDDVSLGVCKIYRTRPRYLKESNAKEWAICKYDPLQPRINLRELSENAIKRLAMEFGIGAPALGIEGTIGDHSPPWMGGSFYVLPSRFYVSPAFISLVQWANAHPRKIKTYKTNSYLGDWATAAVAARET
ncbi:hypothetical protein [Thiobacillus denitrificans]|uniref:hypothetical protein n=1 Tax=Thiobacillus denitrificans TaxID=36861 RepID=UPI0003817C81|nr:hypothetical protein [Thiobacillus denitrificans]